MPKRRKKEDYIFEDSKRIMQKGGFKMILMYFLEEKSMSGYEIMKTIESYFNGEYSPSPGIVYPTLQMLEEVEFVKSQAIGNKKIYMLTEKGKKYLEENREEVEAILRKIREVSSLKDNTIFNSLKKLIGTLHLYSSEINEEKAKAVTEILDDARKKIIKIFEGDQNG
ncbi:PadR family transcriptional regulator [Fervidicoccus fontis]|uniref:Transcriptional regulator, PadR family n=2 Tax=Fervidicoccus fontis TaxID=683846 RepID=I0A132_FERFK|nr:PadR family transcriptional regulator [Fervidicoccus fontis]AFH42689.1 transcriptional regulator, PadR family [Fervidicoccus fontis Kam940]MBE9391267.1 PadR family transcriptional regulator [Fervidicoccus fontis]PMB78446.1 MAG: PadR family transcriptional regulator [Fervidicoccus fontis]HEW63712.1 PadR family transcriptional regulator [Fervidicoccus fontis]